MKKKQIIPDVENVEIPQLEDCTLDSCLSLLDFQKEERQVSWEMIERGRRTLTDQGIDHVYYECPINNQKSVQFIVEECVREFYNFKVKTYSESQSQSMNIFEKLKRVSL